MWTGFYEARFVFDQIWAGFDQFVFVLLAFDQSVSLLSFCVRSLSFVGVGARKNAPDMCSESPRRTSPDSGHKWPKWPASAKGEEAAPGQRVLRLVFPL